MGMRSFYFCNAISLSKKNFSLGLYKTETIKTNAINDNIRCSDMKFNI